MKISVLVLGILCSVNLGAQNLTRPNIAGAGGARVNSYTGNMFLQRTDFTLPGRVSLELLFSYNSTDRNRNRGYGRGWTLSYGMQVLEDTSGITVLRSDGRKDKFTPAESGGLKAPKGIFDSLVFTGNGTYLLKTRDGMKYFFADAGHKRLIRYEDRNGNGLSFNYTDSLITRISDNAGRSLQLNYSGGFLISAVDTNAASIRTCSYQYDNLGNLLKVTDPMGYTRQYGYLVNGPMNTVTDRNGNVTDIVYDGNFAVREIITCLSRMNINYSPGSKTTYVTELVNGVNQQTSYVFDASGNLVQKAGNCCGYNVKYEYDADKNISKRIDANGKIYSYTYDAQGNMLSETDPLGNKAIYTYEPLYNNIAGETDKNGNTTTYQYDARGNLLQVNKPLNITEKYTYAPNGDMLTNTDGRGITTGFTYSAYGHLNGIYRPHGSVTRYAFDAKGRKLSETNPRGYITLFSYDSLNRLRTTTDALNKTTHFAYDANSNLVAVTDGNNHTTRYAYDALDRRVKTTNALGKSKLIRYDAKGNLLSQTDENGNTTTYTYDNLNRVTSQANPLGETSYFEYDSNGNTLSTRYPNGNIVQTSYDGLNRAVEIKDAIGIVKKYGYDNNGNIITETDGNGNTTSFGYDALDRKTSNTDALGNTAFTVYDKNNNIIAVTDRNGHTTTSQYDSLNRRISTKDPLEYITLFAYDTKGNLTGITDANNHTTSYTYDVLDRAVKETMADSTSKSFTYDAVGNVLTRLDANGVTTLYQYDSINRLLKMDYPGTNDDNYTYDAAGQMRTAINSDATVMLDYDPAGRLVAETLNGKRTGYIYDIPGKKMTLQYPGGRVITEQYDNRNRLEKVLETGSAIAEYTYDPGDRNTLLKYQNGTYTNITYDNANRVTSMVSNPGGFLNLVYTYDKEGNKLYEKKLHAPTRSEQYIYDNDNRLTGFKRGTLTGNTINAPLNQVQYNYDGVGNRTSVNDNGNIINYTTNTVNAYTQISGPTPVSPAYDNIGNTIFDGNFNYAYNTQKQKTNINNGTIASYKYDALGRRIKKIIPNLSINYYYSRLGIIQEDSANTSEKTFTLGSEMDNIISMNRNGADHYYHYNNLNSVIILTAQDGSTKEKYEYNAFGDTQIYDSGGNIILSTVIGNIFGFTGRQIDNETKNYYYRLRNYHPQMGRFSEKDPIGYLAGDMNLYAYVHNNPTNFIDPLGLCEEPKFCEKNPAREPNGMLKCPKCLKNKSPNPPGWRSYTDVGDPAVFHCGFRGILENKPPSPDNPMNECFYDQNGDLVDKSHPYAGCMGTPDQYDGSKDWWKHIWDDTGGIRHKGLEGWTESRRYYRDNKMFDPTLPYLFAAGIFAPKTAITVYFMFYY